MERFLASPYFKALVLCFVLLVILGFAYHIAHNLRMARHSPSLSDTAPPAHGDTIGSSQRQ